MTALTLRAAFADSLIREAGACARQAFRGSGADSVRAKGPQDWVTETDLEVERLIRARIRSCYPDDGLLGEEHGLESATAGHGTWVIDPIDGTTCFINGIAQWSVVLGYLIEGEPGLAAVYDPIGDELFSAVQGRGAYCNYRPIHISNAPDLRSGLVSLGSSDRGKGTPPALALERLVAAGGRNNRIGCCALALAYVACGRLLGMFEPRVHAWDSLAAELLVREAGGRTTPAGRAPTDATAGAAMAGTPAVWSELTGILRESVAGACE